MRVVHCIYDDPQNPWVGGGGSVRLREIYRRLVGRVEVRIVTGRFPGARDETVEGVRYERVGAEGPYAWSRLTYGRAATRLLAGEPYDAAVFDFSAYTPISIPRRRPVGVMLGQIAGPTARRRWGLVPGAAVAAWERHQLAGVQAVCAVSAWLLEQARPLVPPGAHLAVVGAGVDDELFTVPRDDAGYLLYYGRFDVFQKGIDTVVEAFALLAAQRPHLRLVLAGRGRDQGRISEMVAARGLADRTDTYVSPAPEQTRQLFAGASALLMPSRFEGFGMVAAEAMAGGVPLVASNVDALPDVVGADGALTVLPDDAPALAAAAASLLDDPALRARLSVSARERARRYSWEQVADDHLRFLQHTASLMHPQHPHATR